VVTAAQFKLADGTRSCTISSWVKSYANARLIQVDQMGDERESTAKQQNGLAARIAAWTAVLVAIAALLGAITSIGKQAEPFSCFFYSFSWCPHDTDGPPTPTPPSPTVAYAQYTIFVYYQAAREGEAKDVANALKAKGFQIRLEGPTDLSSTGLNKGRGDTFILPNNRGAEITDVVLPIVHNKVLEAHKRAVELGGVYDQLKKGDVQVQLW
jgi:hypothetical protein